MYPPRAPLTESTRPQKSVGSAKRRWLWGLTTAVWLAPLFVLLTLQFAPPENGLVRFLWQLPLVYNPAFAIAWLTPRWLVVSLAGRFLLLVALYRALHGREPAQIGYSALIYLDRLTQLWAAFYISEAGLIAGFQPRFGSLYLWLVIVVCTAVLGGTTYYVIIRE